MKVSEGFDSGVNHALRTFPVRDVVAVGYGFAAHGLNFFDHLIGWA